jgi:hypothetical protein
MQINSVGHCLKYPSAALDDLLFLLVELINKYLNVKNKNATINDKTKRDSDTRFSTLGFFHQTIPPRVLIHGLKPFRIMASYSPRKSIRKSPKFYLTPRDLIARSHWHRWIRFRCLIETTELFNINVQFRSRGDTAESELFTRLSRFSRRIRSHMRKGFSRESGPYGGLFDEKSRRSKISFHCPFKLIEIHGR